MLDSPTESIPTAEEMELWQLDLAKRIVRNTRAFLQSIDAEDKKMLEEMRSKNDRQASVIRNLSGLSNET